MRGKTEWGNRGKEDFVLLIGITLEYWHIKIEIKYNQTPCKYIISNYFANPEQITLFVIYPETINCLNQQFITESGRYVIEQ